jgi:hypothetical protein
MIQKEDPFEGLQIVNSVADDVDFIFSLFDHAIEYQKKHGYDLWPQFHRQLIETEIQEKRHWKLINGKDVICIFSVMYNDPVIWQKKDHEPSVYLHRITVNPLFKGMNTMNMIRKWAIVHAREHDKKFVRMDTWGNNVTLRNYYICCGFNYIGQQYLKETKGLPAHYGGSVLSLFQIDVN